MDSTVPVTGTKAASPAGPRVSARAIITNPAGEILLIRHDDGGRVFHVLPGGRQECGETAAETVRREVMEETGLTIRVGELRWVREYIPQRHVGNSDHRTSRHQLQLYFDAEIESGADATAPLRPDRTQAAIVWQPWTALDKVTLNPVGLSEHLAALGTGHRTPVYLGDLA